MLNRIFKTILLGVFSLVITTTFTSCEEENETIAVIIVKDGSGSKVSNARVVLHANPLKQSLYAYNPDNYNSLDDLVKSNLDTVYSSTGQNSNIFRAESTDNNGRVEFTFPLEMVLNVSVLKIDGNDEYLGANIILLTEGVTVTKIVEIN